MFFSLLCIGLYDRYETSYIKILTIRESTRNGVRQNVKKPNRSGKGRFGFLWLLGVCLVAAAAEDAEEEEEEVDEIEVEIHRAHRSETVSHSGIEI